MASLYSEEQKANLIKFIKKNEEIVLTGVKNFIEGNEILSQAYAEQYKSNHKAFLNEEKSFMESLVNVTFSKPSSSIEFISEISSSLKDLKLLPYVKIWCKILADGYKMAAEKAHVSQLLNMMFGTEKPTSEDHEEYQILKASCAEIFKITSPYDNNVKNVIDALSVIENVIADPVTVLTGTCSDAETCSLA